MIQKHVPWILTQPNYKTAYFPTLPHIDNALDPNPTNIQNRTNAYIYIPYDYILKFFV